MQGEWRECDYGQGLVVGFLEDVVGIMGVLVDAEGES